MKINTIVNALVSDYQSCLANVSLCRIFLSKQHFAIGPSVDLCTQNICFSHYLGTMVSLFSFKRSDQEKQEDLWNNNFHYQR